MRPSQYHYIKRMWVRYFYNKQRKRQKRKSLFNRIFRLIIWLYVTPLKIIASPFIFIANLIRKKCANIKLIAILAYLFAGAIIFQFLKYLLINFDNIWGIGIFASLALTVVLWEVLHYSRKIKQQNKDDDLSVNDEKLSVNDEDFSVTPENPNPQNIYAEKDKVNNSQENSHQKEFDLLKFAIECNAKLEHDEEMLKYQNFIDESDNNK